MPVVPVPVTVVPVPVPIVPVLVPVVVPVVVPVGPVAGGERVPAFVPVLVPLRPRRSVFDLYLALAAFWHFSRLLLDLSFLHSVSAFASFCV